MLARSTSATVAKLPPPAIRIRPRSTRSQVTVAKNNSQAAMPIRPSERCVASPNVAYRITKTTPINNFRTQSPSSRSVIQ